MSCKLLQGHGLTEFSREYMDNLQSNISYITNHKHSFHDSMHNQNRAKTIKLPAHLPLLYHLTALDLGVQLLNAEQVGSSTISAFATAVATVSWSS